MNTYKLDSGTKKNKKKIEIDEKKEEQAGAERSKAQPELGLKKG